MLNYFRNLLLNLRDIDQLVGPTKEHVPAEFFPLQYPPFIEHILLMLLGRPLKEKQLRSTVFALMIKDHPSLRHLENVNFILPTKRYFLNIKFSIPEILRDIKQSSAYLLFEEALTNHRIKKPTREEKDGEVPSEFVNLLVAIILLLDRFYIHPMSTKNV